MGDFIYFTEEQKERANAVPILNILRDMHEEVESPGTNGGGKDIEASPSGETGGTVTANRQEAMPLTSCRNSLE